MRRSDRSEADVLLHGEAIGLLWQSHGTTTFELASSYWDNPNRAVLGQRFEERDQSFLRQGGGRLPVWFSNLLPEGRLRTVMADHYGFNEQNEFRLLLELGSDLPGAITIDTEGSHFQEVVTANSSMMLDDDNDSVGGSASRIDAVARETLERVRAAWSEIGGSFPLSQGFVERLGEYQKSLPLCGGSSMLQA